MSSLVASAAAVERAGHMGAEVEEGNVEYKYKLTDLTDEQLVHRITQLNWRLNEGDNEAVYKIGVRDDGYPVGLSEEELEESLSTLQRMAAALNCTAVVRRLLRGTLGTVAEVHFQRRESSVVAPLQVDVCVAGDTRSGKSTLISVLTQGRLDDGRGLARTQVCKHNHELAAGHTSSISHHLLFFGHEGQVLKPHSMSPRGTACLGPPSDTPLGPGMLSATDTCPLDCGVVSSAPGYDSPEPPSSPSGASQLSSRVRALSEEDVLRETLRSVSFIDLAGHEKYMKTALHGMVGRAPQFCLLVISAVAGTRTGGSISNVTREHLALASAMKLRLVIVITKTDLVPTESEISRTVESCCSVLRACGMEGSVVRSGKELWTLFERQDENEDDPRRALTPVPVFLVSSVTGQGVALLSQFLFRVKVPLVRSGATLQVNTTTGEGRKGDTEGREDTEILLLDHFRIAARGGPQDDAPGCCGEYEGSLSPTAALKCLGDPCPVSSVLTGSGNNSSVLILFGSVRSGNVCVGDKVMYGPDDAGHFSAVQVYSIHVNRVSLRAVGAGRCACFALREVPRAQSSSSITSMGPLAHNGVAVVNTNQCGEEAPALLKISLDAIVPPVDGHATPPKKSVRTNGLSLSGPTDDENVLKLRDELRINHVNDPRRRKLRVGDPSHPSNVPVLPDLPANAADTQCNGENMHGTQTCPLGWPFRPGMVLVSSSTKPTACMEFEANILVLNHPKRIRVNYEPVVHGLGTKQSAKLLTIRKLIGGTESGEVDSIKNGDRALCRFRFLYRPEYLPLGTNLVLREGRTRAIGIVTAVSAHDKCGLQ